ncbi:MAG: class I SAM-dependent methyltransferase [Nitrososphaeria archaeon]
MEVAKKIYHDVVVGDVRFLPFRIKSVDVIIVTELIEHLSKSDAHNLIKDMEVLQRNNCN